jgi:hypothetical protein
MLTRDEQKIVKKDRGLLLSAMLVLGFLGTLEGLAMLSNHEMRATMDKMYGKLPEWYNSYTVISFIIILISYYGIYKWKKWGAYLYGAAIGINVAVMFNTGIAKSFLFPLVAISTAASAFFWGWVIYRKWKYFD